MPLQATSGAASYDAFGGGVPVVPQYIEDVFSTYLYTGTGANRTITNDIDLSTKGGMVWVKKRDSATNSNNLLTDTVRGAQKPVLSNSTSAQLTASSTYLSAFTTSGFSLGSDSNFNGSGNTFASWTFRKQPKFFDIVTYTGTGSNTTIAHALGSVPACIMVKRTDTSGDWQVYHRSLANTEYLVLNSTAAKATGATRWNSTTPTSTVFSIGTDATVNASGGTYVAYIFAHDAGGFGLTGTDNVISCGTYSGNGSTQEINLGYEPQWILLKRASGGTSNWIIFDTMRGMSVTDANLLYPNASDAEAAGGQQLLSPTAAGFSVNVNGTWYNASGSTYIYIAIRRGPMKVPTSGTSVYNGVLRTGTGAAATVTGAGFPTDLAIIKARAATNFNVAYDRLRGAQKRLATHLSDAEATDTEGVLSFTMDGVTIGTRANINESGQSIINWFFRRAPSVLDVVCYSGTNATQTLTHNLTVVPQMWIVKNRTSSDSWIVGGSVLGSATADRTFLQLDLPKYTQANTWTTPTSTTFGIGTAFQSDNGFNASGQNYVAYLFATCAGVSKVGSYTGTATTKQIDCGFTGGARFVLIKRTDDSGDWYVWDSARGIVSGNDPYLLLNSSAAEVTSTDYIDTYSAGFEISSTAPAAINASGGTFIFLAIA